MILVYIYIGVTYQNDMMYDNVWHDIVWEGGGAGNVQKSPNPIWNQEPGGTGTLPQKVAFYVGLNKKNDDFLKLYGSSKAYWRENP